MTATLLAVMAVLLYLVAEVLSIGHLVRRNPVFGRATTGFLVAGLLAQFAAMELRARALGTVPYRTLTGSMSLYAWMLGIAYLILALRHRERALGPFLIPLVVLFSAISILLHEPARPAGPDFRGVVFAFHVTIAILAYAAFTLSFVLSVLYLIQNRQLQRRKTGLLFARLPSLDVIGRMNRTSVVVGVGALAIAVVLGATWADHVWGYIWDGKILWALLTLFVYALFLFLESHGWQGKRAAILSIAGFGLVLFSYTIANLFLVRMHTFR
jgi:ABC-type transport system involved in cytochrome c biogenesis permease subunit